MSLGERFAQWWHRRRPQDGAATPQAPQETLRAEEAPPPKGDPAADIFEAGIGAGATLPERPEEDPPPDE